METMRILTLLLFSLTIFSCSSNGSEEQLKMEILNEEIIYVLNGPDDYNSNPVDHERYWKYSTNTITIKFTNVSDKPLVFCFDKSRIGPFHSKDCESGMYDVEKRKKIPKYELSFDFKSVANSCVIAKYHRPWSNDSLRYFGKYYIAKLTLDSLDVKEQILKGGVTQDQAASKSVYSGFYVLYPNQSKFVSFQIALPLTDYRRDFQYYYYQLDSSQNAYAQLTLQNEKIEERNIPDDVLKDIKENDYSFFNGRIVSNRVPVKMITMP